MTPEQLRMGRAAARLGVRDLATLAAVSPATVTRLEGNKGGINMASASALRGALESKGVRFLDDGDAAQGAGVSLRASEAGE